MRVKSKVTADDVNIAILIGMPRGARPTGTTEASAAAEARAAVAAALTLGASAVEVTLRGEIIEEGDEDSFYIYDSQAMRVKEVGRVWSKAFGPDDGSVAKFRPAGHRGVFVISWA